MDEDVTQFMMVTDQPENVARHYVEMSGGDAGQAIQLFFENPDLLSSLNAPSTSSNTRQTATGSSGNRPGRAGRQDSSGVIHIDSDDDFDMNDPGDDDDDGVAEAVRNAQEDEDAAMARRMQEEMYGGQNAGQGADDVRAPIAQTTEMLSAPDPSWSMADDRESAILEQLRRRQAPRRTGGSGNPFSQSVWDSPDAPPVPSSSRPGQPGGDRAQRLADLFRPPYDLMSNLSWDDARDDGKEEKKWLLINLQNMNDFNCQSLNRDHWKDPAIKALVKEHFIFLQYDKDDPQGDGYVTFYMQNQAHENAENYPHVAVVDPRTGERVKVWSGIPFPTPSDFHSDLVEFLDRYSLSANSKNPVAVSKPAKKPVDYGRMTEEEMLEMALQNSLNSQGGASGSNVEDPDALTKAKEEAEGTAGSKEEIPEAESAFARISSTSPHTEPENNPATTTRIQFRHSSGRVIRRFTLSDPVARIYEWLKAEPFEGKEGVAFELKAMPAGRDLIEEVEKTIEEAGLKQATIMIEFIED